MPLRGPTFADGLEGSGPVEVRPDRPNENGGCDVWITFGNSGGATRYDLSDITVRSSFAVPSHIRLSTPVAYDSKLGLNICVVNNNLLLAFNSPADGVKLENLLEKGVDLGRKSKAVDLLLFQNDCCILFDDGQLQTASFLMNNRPQPLKRLLPQNSTRFDTRLFHLKERIFASHAYESGGKSRVKFCSVLLDPENKMCKQNEVKDLELGRNIVSVALLGSVVVFVDGDGLSFVREALDEEGEFHEFEARRLTLKGRKVSLSKAEFVSRLDDGKVAVLGLKKDSEGHAVIVVDVAVGSGGFVIDGASVKSVQSDGGKPLSCHDGDKILFKHGHRIAFLAAERLPVDLASYVGKSSFQMQNSSETFQESLGMEGETVPTWERLEKSSQAVQLYDVLSSTLTRGNVEGAVKILNTFSDIPDLPVLSLIEMVASAPDNSFRGATCTKEDLLSRLFLVEVTETMMMPHLRRSEFALVKKMLKHLLDMVKIESTQSSDDDFDKRFDHILTWIGLILNAHYCNFLLAEDESSQHMLTDALETIETIESCVLSMGATMSYLKLVQDHQIVQPDCSNKMYSIEMVNL